MKSKCVLVVSLLCWSTVLVKFGNSVPGISFLTKILFSTLIWIAVLVFPKKYIIHNDFQTLGKWLLYLLLFLGLWQIGVSIFNDDPRLYMGTNKYLTLFFNNYTSFIFIPPLFAFLAMQKNIIFIIMQGLKKFLMISILLFPIHNNFHQTPFYSIPFFVLSNNRLRFLILVGGLLTCICFWEGSRTSLITLFLSINSIILAYYIKKDYLIKLFCLIFLVLPFLLFIPLLYSNDESIFVQLGNEVSGKSTTEDLSSDTRTFLYKEMAEDLSRTESWIMGKGAFSHYHSDFFYQVGGGDFYERMQSEVTFLNFLLHGGIVYTVCYNLLIFYAIFRALKFGKSKFSKSIALLLSSYFFCQFFGEYIGCNLLHLVLFVLVGFCLSKTFLAYTDNDIKRIYYESSIHA